MASLADNVARVIKTFSDIKTAIIERGVSVENNTPVEEYPDKIRDVSLTNFNLGYSEGFFNGEREGRIAQYDEFWDNYQNNGARTKYKGAFAGIGWNDETFIPKYTIRPTNDGVYMMFMDTGITDIRSISIDTSKVTNFLYLAYLNSSLKYVGIIDCSSATSLDSIFMFSYALISIDKIINVKATCVLNNMFLNCRNLVHVIFENCEFGQNGFSVASNSKLDKDSIISIFNSLSTTTTNLTVTFNKTAVNNAFGINVDDETTYTDEWKSLTESKKNWNIAYA